MNQLADLAGQRHLVDHGHTDQLSQDSKEELLLTDDRIGPRDIEDTHPVGRIEPVVEQRVPAGDKGHQLGVHAATTVRGVMSQRSAI